MKKGQVFTEKITGMGRSTIWLCTKDSVDVELEQTITVWSGVSGGREEVFYCTKGCEKAFGFEVIGGNYGEH